MRLLCTGSFQCGGATTDHCELEMPLESDLGFWLVQNREMAYYFMNAGGWRSPFQKRTHTRGKQSRGLL